MSTLIVIWAITGFLLALLAFIALRTSLTAWRRFAVLALLAVLLGTAYVAEETLLGNARPTRLEALKQGPDEANVLYGLWVEGDGIYLLLQVDPIPTYYRLPWDRQLAEDLQKALQEAARSGGSLRMRSPFEPSWDDREPRFYALPQPKGPDKPYPPPPEPYRHPEYGI